MIYCIIVGYGSAFHCESSAAIYVYAAARLGCCRVFVTIIGTADGAALRGKAAAGSDYYSL